MSPEPAKKSKKFPISRSAGLVFLVACLLISLTPARSQTAIGNLSIEYMAGFAFFKFAKVEPNFRTWVIASESYKKSTPVERSRMGPIEVANLQNRFANYIVADNPIEIKTRVKVSVPTVGRAKRMLSEKGFVSIKVKLADQDDYHFPLQIADMWVALIPVDFEKHLTLNLNADQYESFRIAAVPAGLTSGNNAMLNITLLPTQADTTKPLKIKDFELWMLLAEIENMELWSAKGDRMVWLFEIPGSKNYISKNRSDVLNLYGD